MAYQIIMFGLIALFFSSFMIFRKRDWSYGGELHDAKQTRNLGWQVFWGIFFVLMVLWGIGNNN
jgi:hypothetical protein